MENHKNRSSTRAHGKRDHAFAWESRSRFSHDIGSKRARKPVSRLPIDEIASSSSNKTRKVNKFKKAKKQVRKHQTEGSQNLSLIKQEVNRSQTYFEQLTVATKLNKFLQSGLLNGKLIRCCSKGNYPSVEDAGFLGKFKIEKIICYCHMCIGTDIKWSPTGFEAHAGCKKKHPAENFYFMNGKTVRDVINACKDLPFPSEELIEVVQDTIGSPIWPTVTENKKGSEKESQPSDGSASDATDNSDMRFYESKFQSLLDDTTFTYYYGKKILKEGVKKGQEIHCQCCNKKFSPSDFEKHAYSSLC